MEIMRLALDLLLKPLSLAVSYLANWGLVNCSRSAQATVIKVRQATYTTSSRPSLLDENSKIAVMVRHGKMSRHFERISQQGSSRLTCSTLRRPHIPHTHDTYTARLRTPLPFSHSFRLTLFLILFLTVTCVCVSKVGPCHAQVSHIRVVEHVEGCWG
jgi:hypothetical protein